ncbi:AfsR/SARP family transcriptional regulator [Actinomadura macra]|uniref:AfsR/SARP family transcriptional regulator n=1 Tax=Actinomadura macra TaxID=46164 RepID=UPI001470AAEC|nr:BTAD domain-containing putative transcriptional regulator [Actinomadura macra]
MKHRQLLALLLLRANHAVSTDQLVDGMWPGDPPSSAKGNVKTYISVLRPLVCEAGAMIETVPRGYRLIVPVELVDVLLFEALVQAGSRAAQEGDDPRVVQHLERATALWRGEALQDVLPCGGPIHSPPIWSSGRSS